MAEKSARARNPQDPFRTYEEYFVATPDPWSEVAKLEPGGDRTFATTVRAMVINAEPAQRPALETKLLAVLAAPALTDEGRMFACRMLALIGSETCVPALAALLGQERTAAAARYALDALDVPAVNDAYRGALGQLRGPAKAGLIGAIGLRGDTTALPLLNAIRHDSTEPEVVRTAATRALDRMADPKA